MIFLLHSISSTILKGTGFLCEVPYGEYIVREIKAPDGYILSDKKYPVTIIEKFVILVYNINILIFQVIKSLSIIVSQGT